MNSKADNPAAPRLVVGLGASAGGLEALRSFFEHVPAHTGAAFVVIQHLSPDFKSLMVELLSRHAKIPVERAVDGAPVLAGHVYLLPPKKTLSIEGGTLHLADRGAAPLGLPIDHFFRTLAEDQGERAVAVVLSGTGTDGARGIRHIKEAGGFIFVQAPSSAQFDGMPRAAHATGLADLVLAPEQMPEHIQRLVEIGTTPAATTQEDADSGAFSAILAALQRQSGVDFSEYKKATLGRRITRRIQVLRLDGMEAYAARLREDPAEVSTLFREMLIGVTRMFRDPEAFEALAKTVIPAIVASARRNDAIRVWVPGCSTGEEAYSIAMLFREAIEETGRPLALRVFATDIDRDAIDVASAGVYPEGALAEVTSERRGRFFVPCADGFQVSRQLRDCLVFAVHNVARDAPFARIDLVSCRNLLIYFEPSLQQRVLSLLHFAQRERGYLFLGGSESVGDLEGVSFAAVQPRHKIYQRVGPTGAWLSLQHAPEARLQRPAPRAARSHEGALGVDLASRELVERYAPPSLLATFEGELAHVFGDGGAVLRVPTGAASLAVAQMLPRPLASLVTLALQRVARERLPFTCGPVLVDTPQGSRSITVAVRPLEDGRLDRPLALVSFEGLSSAPQPSAVYADVTDADERLAELKDELSSTRESLQATIEELETSNEEMQATNEELLASNEELQSANEELQSVNEELITVNTEHQAKIQELLELGTDIDNVLSSASISTLFLGKDLQIRQFSPDVAAYINVLPRDVGRPLDHITFAVPDPRLIEDVHAVAGGTPLRESTLTLPDGRSILRRTLAYRTRAGERSGVLTTYIDVSAVVRAEVRLQNIIDALPHEAVVVDAEGRIALVNAKWREAMVDGGAPPSSVGTGADYVGACSAAADRGDADAVAVTQGLRQVLSGAAASFSYEYSCVFKDEMRWYIMSASSLEGPERGAVITHVDITMVRRDALKRAEPGTSAEP